MVDLEKWGRIGVDRLKKATPVDTGETRNGWHYAITAGRLRFYNDNANVVRFICYGHMSTGGTWVPGNDFVTPVIKEIQNDIRKESLANADRVRSSRVQRGAVLEINRAIKKARRKI